jgi:signal transduction histidine kinase
VWGPLRGTNLRGLWLLGACTNGARGQAIQYAPQDLHWLTAAIVLETLHFAEQERRAAAELRTLYQQVVTAQEVERSRLARELHDGVQDLCAVMRDLRALEAHTDPGHMLAEGALPLADMVLRAAETVQALRAICNDLHPPFLQHDLAAALRGLVAELDRRSPQPIHIEIAADDLHLPDVSAKKHD